MARKPLNLTGQRFGRLVAIHIAGQDSHRNMIWHCQCDCGNTTDVITANLRQGHVQSCGCLVPDENGIRIELKRYGDLTVLNKLPGHRGRGYWRCLCSCGNEVILSTHDLNYRGITRCDRLKGMTHAA